MTEFEMKLKQVTKAVSRGKLSRRDFMSYAMSVGITAAAANTMFATAARAEPPGIADASHPPPKDPGASAGDSREVAKEGHPSPPPRAEGPRGGRGTPGSGREEGGPRRLTPKCPNQGQRSPPPALGP